MAHHDRIVPETQSPVKTIFQELYREQPSEDVLDKHQLREIEEETRRLIGFAIEETRSIRRALWVIACMLAIVAASALWGTCHK